MFIGFTLVRRSDLINTLFPIMKDFRSTYQGDHAHELFKELQLDCAGEHISAEFQEAAITNGIIIMYGSDRKENMGLAEVTTTATDPHGRTDDGTGYHFLDTVGVSAPRPPASKN